MMASSIINAVRRARFALLLAAPVLAAEAKVEADVGVSYFGLRGARFEAHPAPFFVDEGSKAAPFVAAGYAFSERFAVRASYHYLHDVKATAGYGHPPGVPGQVVLPVVVYGHYEDDVHLVGLAPELRWAPARKVVITVAPVLNWVASRGVARYSFVRTDPLALVAPIPDQRHDEAGFTFGGTIGAAWTIGERSALLLSYRYTDLDPSWDREAHILSGALRLKF